MRFRLASLLAGAAVLALSAGGVLAGSDTKDQHQDTDVATSWDAGDNATAQTFTAGMSGQLDRISLYGRPGDWHTISVELRDGGPSGTLLGTAADIAPANGAWFDAAFSPTVHVDSGEVYAIVFGGSSFVYVGGTCTTPYAGGAAFVYRANTWQLIPAASGIDSCITDLAFRTWVAAAAIAPPTIGAAFGAASIALNASTSLTFTITNPNSSSALTGIGFTDTLPAGVVISTPSNIGGSCGGSITATAGTSVVSMTGLTLAASATCSFGMDVTGTTAGTKHDTTSAITSTEGGTGGTASASLVVTDPNASPAPSASAPPTGTVDGRGPGSEAPLLPLVALIAITGCVLIGLRLRPEARVRRR